MPLRSVAALFALLVFLSLAVPGAAQVPATAAPTGDDTSPSVVATAPAQTGAETTPNTTMVVQIRPSGDARWTVSTTVTVETEEEAEAFERLRSDFVDGQTAQLGLPAFERASEAASAATGRSMAITNVERNGTLKNDTGRLVLRFTWTNFARQQGDKLVVRDAFDTASGTWLPSLAPGQTLVIRPPTGYGVDSSPPIGVDNGTLRWTGETTFGTDGPWVIYQGGQQTTTTVTETPPPSGPFSGGLPVWGLVLVGGIGALAVAAYVLRGSDLEAPSSDDGGGVDVPSGDGGASVEKAPVPETETETETDPGGPAVEDEPDDADQEDEVDEELLSDEERVERLLEQNGGRMKQANIVKETGWSNAKVSQLLSAMADDGRIEKLRLGRENLISFPDEDIADFE